MAWIETVTEDGAQNELKSIYDSQRKQAGAIANVIKVYSLSPVILEAHLKLYSAVMHAPASLSRKRREMIAVVVSALNQCEY